jgi:hypothetical protein
MKNSKKEHIRAKQRVKKEKALRNIDSSNYLQVCKDSRYVYIKYEDFGFDQYQYSGRIV